MITKSQQVGLSYFWTRTEHQENPLMKTQ